MPARNKAHVEMREHVFMEMKQGEKCGVETWTGRLSGARRSEHRWNAAEQPPGLHDEKGKFSMLQVVKGNMFSFVP
jgi:hypothetical protein